MSRLKLLAAGAALVFALSAIPGWAKSEWIEEGPGPIIDGADEGLPDNPASGAVTAILPSPDNPDLLFVGTVNGGIWVTTNSTSSAPHWMPLTDQALPALSMSALAASPVNNAVLFAGTGSTSSFAASGSPGFGIARSSDNGATWSVLAEPTFSGQTIVSIVPTRLQRGAVVLAATRAISKEQVADPDAADPAVAPARASAVPATTEAYGLYLSSNALARNPERVAFTRLSGAAGSGLPDTGVSALIGDPANPRRFYLGISAADDADDNGANAGVYVSEDGGSTWRSVNGSGRKALTGLETSGRILLAAHTDQSSNIVYAAVISNTAMESGTLSGVFRSTDQGGHWTSLGIPRPPIFSGKSGNVHGALVADPTNPNIVFIAGDSQDSPFPNPNGCKAFSGSVFRGDASQPPAKRWQNVVCNGAQGTSPHADSRSMAFDANGDLLEANDGGIYRLTHPNDSAARKWVSVVGDIRVTEFHSVAYDPLSGIVFGGTQDNGTPIQMMPGKMSWAVFRGGDGGGVAIDADQKSHPGTTLRYTSSRNLGGFSRSTWDAHNILLDVSPVGLNVVSGPCAGQTLVTCDPSIGFYNPFVLNAVDPRRLLIGTKDLYESLNRGASLFDLGGIGEVFGDSIGFGQPIVYGGTINGKGYPGVIYAGAGNTLLHRIARGQPILPLPAYGGGTIDTVAINPYDYRQLFVLDSDNRIWASYDEGAHFIEITGNLSRLTSQVGTIALLASDSAPSPIMLIAGGFGVFKLTHSHFSPQWTTLGTGLPNALFVDFRYDQQHDLLLAGSLGRGAWILYHPFGNPHKERENSEPTVWSGLQPPPVLDDRRRAHR